MPEPKIIRPNKGGQEYFVRTNVDVAIYGGILAGGKTFGSILSVAEPCLDPLFRATFFRRTFGQLKQAGGIVDDMKADYGKEVSVPISE